MNQDKRQCGIYCIKNLVNNKMYIGQSDNIERRWRAHRNELAGHRHRNVHLQRAVDKYGIDNFDFSVLELCDVSELNDREMFYISRYNTFFTGYNLTLGGDGVRGVIVSEETKRRMSRSHADISGEKNPMYGKKMIDVMGEERYAAYLARNHEKRVEQARKMEHPKMTDEQRTFISQRQKDYYKTHTSPFLGRKLSAASIEKRRKTIAERYGEHGLRTKVTPVVLLNTGERFDCELDAAQKYGACDSSISQCCSGTSLSAGKDSQGNCLVWAKACDYENLTPEDIQAKIDRANNANHGKYKPNAKAVRCITTGLIYDTVTEAGKMNGLDPSTIVKCCKNPKRHHGRDPITNDPLFWEYVT